MKKCAITFTIPFLIVAGLAIFVFGPVKDKSGNIGVENFGASDPKNATYVIDGRPVTLKNGLAETEAAPGSSSKIATRYFGNEINIDLNGDGRMDKAFLLTQQTGGSGTFYYVVAALNTGNGYVGSQGFFLGDRIAPQATEAGKGNILIVNYAERKNGDSFAVPPSVGVSKWLILDAKTMQFKETAPSP